MGSLKALQEWCRIQCENYNDVDIKNMSTSFRDGLAFCAIIHRHRPDLIDFDSLSKENVYENNRLAFEVAETELGIPALLDPEDMVSMKVPDRLSIITYVSQYYNFFTNKSNANPPSMKRPGGTGHSEPAVKRPVASVENKGAAPEMGTEVTSKRSTLSSTCAACGKHVHLVQRYLIDGKLYHRNCFRCRECSSTLLPGSYKLTGEGGSLVCTHHFAKSSAVNQNGRPDLSKQAESAVVEMGMATSPETPPNRMEQETTAPSVAENNGQATPSVLQVSISDSLESERKTEVTEKGGDLDVSVTEGTKPSPSTPPNPFDETDEEGAEDEEQEKEEGAQKPAADVANGSLPPAPVSHENKPVPAPRRVSEPSPQPRPVPRPRPPRRTQSPTVNGDSPERRRSVPVPRERSHSPGSSSQSGDTPKPKDPPWLALVQSEPKKRPAPRPPKSLASPPSAGSVPSVKVEESRPATPPQSTNPFEDEDDEEEETEPVESSAPPSVVISHPWYGITQTADATNPNTPSSRVSPAPSASPGSGRKKRPAPRAPQTTPSALPQSQSSSACPSPALSTESLSSSSSELGRAQVPTSAEQEHRFTKSVSEPSISEPSSGAAPSSEPKPHPSPSPAPPQAPTNTSSAPSTPQTNRSAGTRAPRPPPPRPPTAPSPLAQLGTPTAPPSASQNKRTCKENPFNRKASPSHTPASSRPPKGPRPARPPAPGHGFPLIKRRVQSDQYIPVEDIHVEMGELERQLDELEQRGVELEKKLRDSPNDEEEERLLVDWFTLIHEKHLLVRREAELVYTAKQQNLEERQADVEYELRCLLNKPEREWTEEDRAREKELMAELVTIIEQRNQIINSMDQDRQREEEEDKLLAAMLKKKEFHGDSEKKKPGKFKPIKVLKKLKGEGAKGGSPRKDKS
ncbi:MICAL-like protein 1 [Chanos chanos]|uniref:MICAL-like protein 1 n=1 Tax=Chanos chanos TaxID=29144 RepID=A0A6J2W3C6_CHACN|nr:MICAL-like protein 1 [Chanos chanos]